MDVMRAKFKTLQIDDDNDGDISGTAVNLDQKSISNPTLSSFQSPRPG